jgi:hypothetical protein
MDGENGVCTKCLRLGLKCERVSPAVDKKLILYACDEKDLWDSEETPETRPSEQGETRDVIHNRHLLMEPTQNNQASDNRSISPAFSS